MLAWQRVALGVLAAAWVGCATPDLGASERLRLRDVTHRWVYYPSARVFACDAHHHFWVYRGGRWLEEEQLALDLDGLDHLQLSGRPAPEPDPDAHQWVFYPGQEVYRCTVHERYWVRVAGGWVLRDQAPGPLPDGVAIAATGPAPHTLRARHGPRGPELSVEAAAPHTAWAADRPTSLRGGDLRPVRLLSDTAARAPSPHSIATVRSSSWSNRAEAGAGGSVGSEATRAASSGDALRGK